MKWILLLFLLSFELFAGTCTTISRSDLSYGSILSAAKYNSDLNTSYTALNSFDGGCTAAHSLEYDALDTGTLEPVLKAVKRGCEVTYATAATLSIGPCYAMVNGYYVSTATGTSVTWTNIDTGSEAATKNYYVYITSGSVGSTLTPKISVTGPTTNGYNTNGDLLIGTFFNDSASNIATLSIYQYVDNHHVKSKRQTTESYLMTNLTVKANAAYPHLGGFLKEGSCSVYGSSLLCYFEKDYFSYSPRCTVNASGTAAGLIYSVYEGPTWLLGDQTTQYIQITAFAAATGVPTTTPGDYLLTCTGYLNR